MNSLFEDIKKMKDNNWQNCDEIEAVDGTLKPNVIIFFVFYLIKAGTGISYSHFDRPPFNRVDNSSF